MRENGACAHRKGVAKRMKQLLARGQRARARYLIQEHDGVVPLRTLEGRHHGARHGPHVGAAVAPHFGLVVDAAQGHAAQGPPQRAGDALPQGRLAHTWRLRGAPGGKGCTDSTFKTQQENNNNNNNQSHDNNCNEWVFLKRKENWE